MPILKHTDCLPQLPGPYKRHLFQQKLIRQTPRKRGEEKTLSRENAINRTRYTYDTDIGTPRHGILKIDTLNPLLKRWITCNIRWAI